MKKYLQKFLVLLVCLAAVTVAVPPIVSGAASKPALSKTAVTLMPYSTYKLKMKNTTGKVSWSSQSANVVKVSQDGVITAKKAGTAKIKAKVNGKGYICTVKVKQPNTANKKARKAFKIYLKSTIKKTWGNRDSVKNSDFKFICLDMGTGKVPTMIVKNGSAAHYEGYVRVYQYINGKIKRITSLDWIDEIDPEAGVFAACYMGGGYGEVNRWFYKVNGKSVAKEVAYTEILSEECEDMRPYLGDDVYKIGGKNTTKEKFNSYYSKLTANSSKNKKIEKLMLKNTENNRNKYFK